MDNSTLNGYTKCNVYGMINSVLHRKPNVESEAAWFGKMFHRFPQYYWQPGEKWKEVLVEFEERFMAFQNRQAAMGRLNDNETIKPEIYLSMAKQFVTQLPRIVNDNGEVIILDERTRHPLYKIRHRPEIGFKFPIGNDDEYVGRLDTLLEDFNGHLWVCDIKTTGEYNRNASTGDLAVPRFAWKEQFKMSTQLTGYIRAVQHHTQQTIAGALVFAIPRAKGKIKIEHIQVRRTQQELEQWEAETETLIYQFKRDAQQVEKEHGFSINGLRNVIPTGKYNGACTRFGLCAFFDICKNGYAPGIIEQTTVYKPWNPLSEEEESE